jgi:hypothetical protein
LEKYFRSIKHTNEKVNAVEFAGIMSKREAELSEARTVMTRNIIKLSSFIENVNDEYTYYLNDNANSYVDNKTLEEKLIYYNDKLLKYIEVYLSYVV